MSVMRRQVILSGLKLAENDASACLLKGGPMALPATGRRATDRDQSPVHCWRVSQLARLGIPRPLAEAYAECVDWHQIAELVQRGCPPQLALRIVA
jgi:hypothetical protein